MKHILILGTLLILASCKDSKPSEYTSALGKKYNEKSIATSHPGKKLMETQCYVCHNPTTPQADRIAPPMVAIKAHYINSTTKKEDFIRDLVSFVDSPTVEKTRMRGAVRKFGVMPYQSFKKGDIEKVAEYLFEYEIEEPSWFKEHFENGGRGNRSYINTGIKNVGSANEKKNYEEIGLSYAIGTKEVLGKNLMQTIQKKGTKAALQFCNEKAYSLTDSMSMLYNADIKRVSDKPRNLKNQATKEELAYIETFKKLTAAKTTIRPIVKKDKTKVRFYYPITTNTMCLQCHGKPAVDIKPNIMNSLTILYPEDKATGYDVNEVRGIWSIHFEPKDN